MQVFRVVRNRAYWYVEQVGLHRAVRGYRCRDNAIARAMDLASGHRPSVVRIEDAQGSIETERNFGQPSGFSKSA